MARRLWAIAAAAVGIGLLGIVGYGYAEATRDPVVRTVSFEVASLPADQQPFRILLMADMHVQEPDMPPSRLERIVGEANALRPDIVVLAGDFTGAKFLSGRSYDEQQAIAPLSSLRAKDGVFAVLGNNDRPHAESALTALRAVGITVLESRAVQLGPIALGGMRTRYGSTIRRLLQLQGTRVLVSHSPDGFARLPAGVSLMLAGHTHCGQIVLPIIGAIATGSQFGSRYLCGVITGQEQALVVTSGLGTSEIPLRINAPPDMWLIILQPPTVGRHR